MAVGAHGLGGASPPSRARRRLPPRKARAALVRGVRGPTRAAGVWRCALELPPAVGRALPAVGLGGRRRRWSPVERRALSPARGPPGCREGDPEGSAAWGGTELWGSH